MLKKSGYNLDFIPDLYNFRRKWFLKKDETVADRIVIEKDG